MDYTELKKIENEINVLQAKMGLLRAELKKRQGQVTYNEVNAELNKITQQIDVMQKRFIKRKEAESVD